MKTTLNWVGGATFTLTFGSLKIACDPVLCPKGTVHDYFWFKSKRIEDPQYNEKTFSGVDIWLITHPHTDHLDDIGISKIEKPSLVVCDAKSQTKLQKNGFSGLNVLGWGDKKQFWIKGYTIEIEAIPAIHGVNPLSAFMAGKVNGYYLKIFDGKETAKIYITGDTVYKQKVIKAMSGKLIDLLIPNMGAAKQGSWIMALTLNAQMLKKMMAVLNPKTVVPVHYGTFEHYVEPASEIIALNDSRIKMVGVGVSIELLCGSKSDTTPK